MSRSTLVYMLCNEPEDDVCSMPGCIAEATMQLQVDGYEDGDIDPGSAVDESVCQLHGYAIASGAVFMFAELDKGTK